MSGQDLSNVEMSDEQMEALLNEESPSRDILMQAPKEESQGPWAEDVFKANGKEIKATRDQILQWASMGYNYPQRAAELKAQQERFEQERAQWEQTLKEMEQRWSPYKEVDEYASKNPDWWRQIQESYKGVQAQHAPPPEIQALQTQMEELKQFIEQQKIEKESIRTQEEDRALADEVESIRKQFSNIDFDTPDAEGKSLEMKVLEHAVNNGIKSFKTAFRDFYHEHLVSKAREEGKELVSKDIQKRTKLGLLGETSKPTKGLKVAENVRSKSYDDLLKEALAEIN